MIDFDDDLQLIFSTGSEISIECEKEFDHNLNAYTKLPDWQITYTYGGDACAFEFIFCIFTKIKDTELRKEQIKELISDLDIDFEIA